MLGYVQDVCIPPAGGRPIDRDFSYHDAGSLHHTAEPVKVKNLAKRFFPLDRLGLAGDYPGLFGFLVGARVALGCVEKENGMIDFKYGTVELPDHIPPSPPPNEPCFILRGQDVMAAVALRAYMQACRDGGCCHEFLMDIDKAIHEMSKWTPKKLPD